MAPPKTAAAASSAIEKKKRKKIYEMAPIVAEGTMLNDCRKNTFKLGKAFAQGGFGRIYTAQQVYYNIIEVDTVTDYKYRQAHVGCYQNGADGERAALSRDAYVSTCGETGID